MSGLSAREILARLVAFPTVSSESNLALIAWVEAYLAGLGVESTRVPSPDGTKSSLYATIGPRVAGGIALSGHSDVVPVTGQAWSSDPFVLSERDGRLYGRGAVDMKGFVALMLAAVPRALKAPLKRPLYLALSYDEETGCEGCVPMIAEMTRLLPPPEAVIVGEPTRLGVVNGHKGSIGLRIAVTGHPVHASLAPYGVDAIMEAARLIGWANGINAANAAAEPGPLGRLFDPPYTTAQVGRIAGGTADNILAGSCWLTLGFRIVPDESIDDWEARVRAEAETLRTRMRARQPDTDVTVERVYSVPHLAPEPDGRAEAVALALSGAEAAHVVSFGTEAGHFQRFGWSSVICGPGDIAQAHKADEYIETAQFEAGERFMDRVVARLCRAE